MNSLSLASVTSFYRETEREDAAIYSGPLCSISVCSYALMINNLLESGIRPSFNDSKASLAVGLLILNSSFWRTTTSAIPKSFVDRRRSNTVLMDSRSISELSMNFAAKLKQAVIIRYSTSSLVLLKVKIKKSTDKKAI